MALEMEQVTDSVNEIALHVIESLPQPGDFLVRQFGRIALKEIRATHGGITRKNPLVAGKILAGSGEVHGAGGVGPRLHAKRRALTTRGPRPC